MRYVLPPAVRWGLIRWLLGILIIVGYQRMSWAAGLQHLTMPIGTTSTQVVPASATRTFLLLINDSDSDLYCSLAGTVAVIGLGIKLVAPNGALLLDQLRSVPRAAVSCIHAADGEGEKNVLVTTID